jgi:PhnB protein
MASVATYLNFSGRTEEAFEFYKTVFGTDYMGEVMRMGDMPAEPDMPEFSDADKRAVMHVTLPILGGHLLMGTDALESMGQSLTEGDNVSIMLQPDSRTDADELFAKLSAGGNASMPMEDVFWGDYFGTCTDRFGIHWMIDVSGEPS